VLKGLVFEAHVVADFAHDGGSRCARSPHSTWPATFWAHSCTSAQPQRRFPHSGIADDLMCFSSDSSIRQKRSIVGSVDESANRCRSTGCMATRILLLLRLHAGDIPDLALTAKPARRWPGRDDLPRPTIRPQRCRLPARLVRPCHQCPRRGASSLAAEQRHAQGFQRLSRSQS
jgi:hypothetical protein